METPDLRHTPVGDASFDVMTAILGVWGSPLQDDLISQMLNDHATRFGVPGVYGVCVASVIMSTPGELVGREGATYVLEHVERSPVIEQAYPGLGETLAQFWVAVVADDLDTAWALLLAFGGKPFNIDRLGSLVTLVITTGVTNLASPWPCIHCGTDREQAATDPDGRYCNQCRHFCDEVKR